MPAAPKGRSGTMPLIQEAQEFCIHHDSDAEPAEGEETECFLRREDELAEQVRSYSEAEEGGSRGKARRAIKKLCARKGSQQVFGLVLGLACVAICVLATTKINRDARLQRPGTKPKGSIDKFGFADGIGVLDGIVKAMSKSGEIMGDAEEALKDTQDEFGGLAEAAKSAVGDDEPAPLNATEKALLAVKVLEEEKLAEKDLTPDETRDDGNICYDDEEFFGGLCFKTCKALTAGKFPLRIAPNKCCMGKKLEDCDIAHTQTSDKPCGGLEVSGDKEGKSGCPNPPGICLSNEEAYAGQCYKKCEYLTKGIYPFRSGPNSCCKIDPSKNGLACFLGGLTKDTKTALEFGVGGGAGDGLDSTPALPHPPDLDLAERTTALPTPQALADLPPAIKAVALPPPHPAVPVPPATPAPVVLP
eukprot:TRINITY_DN58012_c0_g1_i1.p1 TRINITY_DN58012_c0_g1~~TRINITY_DN58012_c0_g1_i1.p1  ORF type:complete len:417 (+),score=93.73 TRINITY_DN58012_c0_g1_i1:54-1304(+)